MSRYQINIGINGSEPITNTLVPKTEVQGSPTMVSEQTKAPLLSNGMLIVYSQQAVGQAINEKLNTIGMRTGNTLLQRRINNVKEIGGIGKNIAGGYALGGLTLGTLNAGLQFLTIGLQQERYSYQQKVDNKIAEYSSKNSVLGNNNGRFRGND